MDSRRRWVLCLRRNLGLHWRSIRVLFLLIESISELALDVKEDVEPRSKGKIEKIMTTGCKSHKREGRKEGGGPEV